MSIGGEWMIYTHGSTKLLDEGQKLVMGGYFTVRRKDIKRHGKGFYQNLIKQQHHKNEAHIMREWLTHLFNQRVSHFFL